MEEAEVVERLREEAERTGDQDFSEAASLIERQQQVIDLLMKAVEPVANLGGLGGALIEGDVISKIAEAKVEAERIFRPLTSRT